jgi:Uma2 family endonuclease
MSIAENPAQAPTVTMSFDEFLALPDDGVRRELIRGELRTRGMTIRNRFHAQVESAVAGILRVWWMDQPRPRGRIVSGEVGFRLRGADDTAVGIDVAYVSPEMAASLGPKQVLFEGPPILAVEILSPSDTFGDVAEKVELYLEVGTVCWVVDYRARTVVVHRPGAMAEALDEKDEIVGDPYLPGFRAHVAELFE